MRSRWEWLQPGVTVADVPGVILLQQVTIPGRHESRVPQTLRLAACIIVAAHICRAVSGYVTVKR